VKTLKKKLRKSVLPMLLALILSMFMLLIGTVSFAQTNSTTTVYMDPPTITGVTVGEEFTVDIKIRDALNAYSWQAGLTFNPNVLECTGFEEGTFLSDVGGTYWFPGTINNTAGFITAHASTLLGEITASGDGQLAYLTFTVKASGISDLHLRDVILSDFELNMILFNIIDVYTAVEDTTPHTVVTVSNSTGLEELYGSGFYDHAFNPTLNEISFKVTGPYPGFSTVMIPKTLLPPPVAPYEWGVLIDGTPTSRTLTDNATHTSIHFTYSKGIHNIHITTRFASSTISMTLNSTSVTLGSTVTISGAIDPLRAGVSVTIEYKSSGGTWSTLATVTTNQNGNYTYPWTPETVGTYELKASWEGDDITLGDESDIQTLTVEEVRAEGIDPYLLVAAVVAIIIIVAIVVYFVKVRKSKEAE
jgi:hypothetical protein